MGARRVQPDSAVGRRHDQRHVHELLHKSTNLLYPDLELVSSDVLLCKLDVAIHRLVAESILILNTQFQRVDGRNQVEVQVSILLCKGLAPTHKFQRDFFLFVIEKVGELLAQRN